MKTFRLYHFDFVSSHYFNEDTAPDWLTSKNTVEGSTMDMCWFWKDHVLTLRVGEFIDTDFHRITRIE